MSIVNYLQIFNCSLAYFNNTQKNWILQSPNIYKQNY